MKKYPILHPICSTYGISKKKIDQTFKIMRNITLKLGISNVDLTFAIKMALVATNERHKFKQGSIGEYYNNLFKKEEIKI